MTSSPGILTDPKPTANRLTLSVARQLWEKALALAPDDAAIQRLAADVYSHGVPSWHFSIVRDERRNAAYDAALRRAVKPGYRVLEIGAGTGLLAMMAARAGAAEVVTCEMNPAVAERAKIITAQNGYGDRVRVVPRHSDTLEVGIDMTAPADVLVQEIVADNLIGEEVLLVMEKTAQQLLRRGAAVIPSLGKVRVALAQDKGAGDTRMGTVDGFDLSAFNRLAKPTYSLPVGTDRLSLCSEPADLFAFDFRSGGPFPAASANVVLTAHGGPVNGIAQWIALEMDENDRYENRPCPGSESAWAVRFTPLSRSRGWAPGTTVAVHGAHDRVSLRIWGEIV
jgi:type III protein arginine methyltransferase